MKAIGFAGLGSMGLPMALNLVATGFEVRGYDPRWEPRAALVAAGGIAVPSLEAAFDRADAAVLMVVDAAQAESVLFDADAVQGLEPGACVVLMSTCPPTAVASLAASVEGYGFGFLDAPVSGGVAGARAASLTIMAAGAELVYETCLPLLRALGRKVLRVGSEPGQGATAKAINQLLCGTHLAAAAEALSLAERLGLDIPVMLDIVAESSAASWMLRDRGPRMLQAAPAVTSAVDIFVKDLGIALDVGRGAKTALPLAAIAHQLFLSVAGQGLGASDDSQVIRAYRSLRGEIR